LFIGALNRRGACFLPANSGDGTCQHRQGGGCQGWTKLEHLDYLWSIVEKDFVFLDQTCMGNLNGLPGTNQLESQTLNSD
jgi:hypothetical protein